VTKRLTSEDLSAYLDGELSAIERERVRAEIAQDPEAARLLEELSAVDAGVRRAPAEPPAAYFDDLPGRVRARLPVVAARKRWRPPVWGLAAVAALFAFALTPLVLREGPSPVATPGPAAAANPQDADAPRPLPPAAPEPATPAPAAASPAIDPLARREADAGRFRDQRLGKRSDAQAEAERKLQQPAPPPAVAAEGRFERKDESPRETAKAKADARVEHQQGFAEAPRAMPERQFGPRVSQQNAADRAPVKKEAGATAAPAERPGSVAEEVTVVADKNASGGIAAVAPAAPAPKSLGITSRRPATAAEARSLRDEARRFVEANPGDPRADATRVRVIELGVEAWRREGQELDRDAARGDAVSYLARKDARQKDRVRELLAAVSR